MNQNARVQAIAVAKNGGVVDQCWTEARSVHMSLEEFERNCAEAGMKIVVSKAGPTGFISRYAALSDFTNSEAEPVEKLIISVSIATVKSNGTFAFPSNFWDERLTVKLQQLGLLPKEDDKVLVHALIVTRTLQECNNLPMELVFVRRCILLADVQIAVLTELTAEGTTPLLLPGVGYDNAAYYGKQAADEATAALLAVVPAATGSLTLSISPSVGGHTSVVPTAVNSWSSSGSKRAVGMAAFGRPNLFEMSPPPRPSTKRRMLPVPSDRETRKATVQGRATAALLEELTAVGLTLEERATRMEEKGSAPKKSVDPFKAQWTLTTQGLEHFHKSRKRQLQQTIMCPLHSEMLRWVDAAVMHRGMSLTILQVQSVESRHPWLERLAQGGRLRQGKTT